MLIRDPHQIQVLEKRVLIRDPHGPDLKGGGLYSQLGGKYSDASLFYEISNFQQFVLTFLFLVQFEQEFLENSTKCNSLT